MSKWRIESTKIIAQALAAGKVAGETGVALRKRVDAAYPFGMRSMLPYKMWLEARRAAFAEHGLFTEKERERYAKMGKQPRYGKYHRSLLQLERDWQAAVESGLITP